ncbi:zinc finger protein 501 [Anabrus simplex]|uniref:zinc finger protein 501 n=1 Tax=Anabrus simplex TaxID=316456 RepID=UPI0035A26AF4
MESKLSANFETVWCPREKKGMGSVAEVETNLETDPARFLDVKIEPPDEDDMQDELKVKLESEEDSLHHKNGIGIESEKETEKWGFVGNDSSVKFSPTRVKTFHKCPECSKIFSHRGDLRKHSFIHTGERPYSCTVCSKTFTQSSNLRTHLRTHSNVQTSYKCPHCGQNFSQNESMLAHMLLHNVPTSHKCAYCPKVYSHSSKLRRHMLSHSEVLHKCEMCGKRFTEHESLIAHKRLHTGECKHKCEQCGKYFTHRGDYRKHLLTHTGERLHPCPHCPKSFSRRCTLRTHLRIHSGEKPHQCSECNRGFTQLAHLRKHERTHMKIDHNVSVMNVTPLVLLREGDSERSSEEILGLKVDDQDTKHSLEDDCPEIRHSKPNLIKEEPHEVINCPETGHSKPNLIKEEPREVIDQEDNSQISENNLDKVNNYLTVKQEAVD